MGNVLSFVFSRSAISELNPLLSLDLSSEEISSTRRRSILIWRFSVRSSVALQLKLCAPLISTTVCVR
ncbi:hypothetical protein COLO4_09789 [Corchorus olitorius]|uniref:Uncharacterized protein n=1 Tax=Corchorus olitorius TaxID=93759 RepID=A0A1R3KB03_9ROSI|nr:hypothetical protein COLO4_09789 [Corchorus olitorius]